MGVRAAGSCGWRLVSPIMALHRKFVAVALASLLASASPAKIASLGMIMHAERAHVGEAEASIGCTLFEGDRLSTEPGGVLRIAISALTLQLGGQSSLLLGHAPGPEGTILAEVDSGTLVFSAAPTDSIVVTAHEALVRPATNAATIAHVRVVNRKELRIYAQRGALYFSYHGESETIPEGKAYRVFLDPSETEVSTLGSDPVTRRPATHHPMFILVGIAVGAGIAMAIPMTMHADESPDRPGPKPPKKP
jgi:hypothetical protein